ncbi:TIGR04086 family membrane protein [Alkalicoccobacillus plakortidis]|uniref:TIGR04086 family membrane protein n=1 Tax=Alkalicoccobacillus plakortidis TaxID=444060 RepID=A0ABT0XKU7_9BACI|nr:TIGR04086 family membrane protein [Alkalicoccobacillus plakortidis]MCM2676533.1 TIGR04086 family membrane protein [Alkalicoccobacillus plakortidis]MCM2676590.1 TIGR04086 family membrane protein [Alkalicoccobacillus plakortidis]
MNDRPFIPAVFSGLVVIMAGAILASLLLASFLSLTSYTEHSIKWLITFLAFFCLFIGGFVSGAKAKTKGWLAGGLTAILFSLVAYLISTLGYDVAFTSSQFMLHGGYLLTGAVGGMIGVNLMKS